ncbi:MAG: hypothetical protein OEN01_10100 [Candidatus Krumholzibacteria bacterium]|nr:hypothetical protein [Candidatus Krumholzibacteria bacterium]
MTSKSSAILGKVLQDRRRRDYDKALKRLSEGIDKVPADVLLYKEAIDIGLEAGESLQAVKFFKTAQRRIPSQSEELWSFSKEKVRSFNDPIFCKFLLDLAIKRRDFAVAEEILDGLNDHTAAELLKRIRTKKQTLTTASGGNQIFKGELIVSALAEGMLCLRSRRYQEAAKTFLRVLDDKPVEHEGLTPYLAVTERNHPREGGIKYVLGCGRLLGEEYTKGVSKLIQGVSLSPTYADDAVARLEALADNPDAPTDHIAYATAKILIIKGDIHEAADRLQILLGKDSDKAAAILELLEPHIEEVGDNLILDYVYIKAALIAKSEARAMGQLRKIYKDRRHRSSLLEWLDTNSQEQSMPTEILAYYGEVLLDEHMFVKAIEIFRELLSRAPQEVHYVKDLVAPHFNDPKIRQFDDEISEGRTERAEDGLGIEHYASRDIDLDTPSSDATIAGDIPAVTSSVSPATDDEGTGAGFEKEKVFDLTGSRTSQNSDDPSPPFSAAANKRFAEAPPGEVPAFESLPDLKRDEKTVPEAVPSASQDATQPDDDSAHQESEPQPGQASETLHLRNSPPNDQDDEGTGAPAVILLGTSDIDVEADYSPELGQPANGVETSNDDRTATEDFETRYKKFEHGDLDNHAIIDLIEEAMKLEKTGEMKTLLTFKPQNIAQEIKRKYYLAEYYLSLDQALSALVILKTVPLNALSKEERRDFLLRIAYSYRQLHRFDAAHSVYLRIMSEDPDSAEVERLARANYHRYLRSSTADNPVLEKVSTLQGVANKEEER